MQKQELQISDQKIYQYAFGAYFAKSTWPPRLCDIHNGGHKAGKMCYHLDMVKHLLLE